MKLLLCLFTLFHIQSFIFSCEVDLTPEELYSRIHRITKNEAQTDATGILMVNAKKDFGICHKDSFDFFDFIMSRYQYDTELVPYMRNLYDTSIYIYVNKCQWNDIKAAYEEIQSMMRSFSRTQQVFDLLKRGVAIKIPLKKLLSHLSTIYKTEYIKETFTRESVIEVFQLLISFENEFVFDYLLKTYLDLSKLIGNFQILKKSLEKIKYIYNRQLDENLETIANKMLELIAHYGERKYLKAFKEFDRFFQED